MSNEENKTEATEEVKEEVVEETKEETKEEKKGDKKSDKKKKLFKKEDPRDEKIKELEEARLRQLAEFENFRTRTQKEKAEQFGMGAVSVIEKILPIIDNFERGFQTLTEEQKKDPFVVGMDKVYQQFMTELTGIGVEPIECVGKEMDPELFNAVMQVASEEYESGVVAQELQKGYTYKRGESVTVVRHAMVAVAE